MSEFINNREVRQQKLKELILRLHDGASVEDVQKDFNKLTDGVSPTEITEMEQALVDEGMPVSDIQRLCDVHAAVFKGSIEDIHKDDGEILQRDDWHPISVLKSENRAIEHLIDNELAGRLENFLSDGSSIRKNLVVKSLMKLATIDKHYSRKENLIFPYMEKHDITAPPQVMWGVDDEIREKIKDVLAVLDSAEIDAALVVEKSDEIIINVKDMIFKEEEIMVPMILEKFLPKEWIAIEKASAEIGYTLLSDVGRWAQSESQAEDVQEAKQSSVNSSTHIQKDSAAKISFDAGAMTAEEVNAVLNTVPLDMTFVGADNRVKYFTQGKERVFDRPITIIGREVKHCHPPKSVHIVEQIVEDLRSGKKDNEDFWIKMGDMFVYIRYFAVRNKQGQFLGTLEVTQDIKSITELEGEKRLMS